MSAASTGEFDWRADPTVIRYNNMIGVYDLDLRYSVQQIEDLAQRFAVDLDRERETVIAVHCFKPGGATSGQNTIAFEAEIMRSEIGASVGEYGIRLAVASLRSAALYADFSEEGVVALLEGPLPVYLWRRVLLLAPSAGDIREWNRSGWPDGAALDFKLAYRIAGISLKHPLLP